MGEAQKEIWNENELRKFMYEVTWNALGDCSKDILDGNDSHDYWAERGLTANLALNFYLRDEYEVHDVKGFGK